MPPTDFTPFTSLAGGLLIGLSAVLLMALHGRILGATGILVGLMRPGDPVDWRLRLALLAGTTVLALEGSRVRLGRVVRITVHITAAASAASSAMLAATTASSTLAARACDCSSESSAPKADWISANWRSITAVVAAK